MGGAWQHRRGESHPQDRRERNVKRRYFIASLDADAQDMLTYIRTHWEVEYKLHWCPDVVFREDESRVRKGHALENLAIMRKIALNVLRKEKSRKCGAKAKRLICAMDADYLLKVIHL